MARRVKLKHHETCKMSMATAQGAFDPNLSVQAKALLFVLGTYVNGPSGDDAWPSQKTLGMYLGASVRSVQRWLDELIERGYVEKKVLKGEGYKHWNTYLLHIPDIVLFTKDDTSDAIKGDKDVAFKDDKDVVIKGDTSVAQKELIEGTHRRNTPSIEDFWEAWTSESLHGDGDSILQADKHWPDLTDDEKNLAVLAAPVFQKEFREKSRPDITMLGSKRFLGEKRFTKFAYLLRAPNPDLDQVTFDKGEWGKVQKVLYDENPAVYLAWFNRLDFISSTVNEVCLSGDRLTIDWCEKTYVSKLRHAILRAWGSDVQIKFVVEKGQAA